MSIDQFPATRAGATTATGAHSSPSAKERRPDRPVTPIQWSLPGFAPMTRITTSFGEVHAQALRERDLVRTRSGEFKPIRWIDRIVLDEEFLVRHPDALPVLIRANALGRGLPRADVMLSPRQPIAPLFNQLPGSAKTAADLLSRPGVFRKTENVVTYTLFHLGAPDYVMTERFWVSVAP
jgi:hypothetical protein